METVDHKSMLVQMKNLEKKYQMYRIYFIVQSVVIILIISLGTTYSSRVIEAERIIIKDRNGVTRSEYGMLSPNDPGIIIYDNNGKNRLELSIINNITFLNINDRNEQRRISMNVSDDGPVIGLSDIDGLMRLGMSVPHQLPGIYLYDKNKESRVILLYSDQLDQGGIFINDINGHLLFSAPN
jgi:hypothetical protein